MSKLKNLLKKALFIKRNRIHQEEQDLERQAIGQQEPEIELDIRETIVAIGHNDNAQINSKIELESASQNAINVPEITTSIDQGLNQEDRLHQRSKYGTNELPKSKPRPLWKIFFQAALDKTLLLLTISGVISLFLNEGLLEGLGILIAVALAILINGLAEWQRDRQFMTLIKADKRAIRVRIEGSVEVIPIEELVVGDIVLLGEGDIVPADGKLVEISHSPPLSIDESSMTGESEHVNKKQNDLVRGETRVMEGSGIMLVTHVGTQTEYGKALVGDNESVPLSMTVQSPLQIKLMEMAELIAKGGLCAGVVLAAIVIVKNLIYVLFYRESVDWSTILVHVVLECITLVVVAVPEGLPVALTLCLAWASSRLLQGQHPALVRILSACETMGSITYICTDKTGTLTLGKMSVESIWVNEGENNEAFIKRVAEQGPLSDELRLSIAVNTLADPSLGRGSGTELALLTLVPDYTRLRSSVKIVTQIPFSSVTKEMSTLVETQGEKTSQEMQIKGAPEIVLARCSETIRERGIQITKQMAVQGLRTLAIAKSVNDLETLKLLAILGIKDPVKIESPSSIEQCRRAGIKVIMVTGDSRDTAIQIAHEVHILDSQEEQVQTLPHETSEQISTIPGSIIEGPAFRQLNDQGVEHILPRLQVLARSLPQDKRRLVNLLRRKHIVAVTGDGTNDTPALRSAHVGLTMGKQGTDVAKAAASIVLLDDSPATLVRCVAWGRAVQGGIRTFLRFQLTVSLSATGVVILDALARGKDSLNKPPLLNALQLLWVNLIMDTLGALALATDCNPDDPQEQEGLLARSPEKPSAPLLSKGVLLSILTLAGFQIMAVLIVGAIAPALAFNCFVLLQLSNQINCRSSLILYKKLPWSREHLWSLIWRRFWLIWFLCAGIQFLIVHFGHKVFRAERALTLVEWLACIAISVASIPLSMAIDILLGKLISYTRNTQFATTIAVIDEDAETHHFDETTHIHDAIDNDNDHNLERWRRMAEKVKGGLIFYHALHRQREI